MSFSYTRLTLSREDLEQIITDFLNKYGYEEVFGDSLWYKGFVGTDKLSNKQLLTLVRKVAATQAAKDDSSTDEWLSNYLYENFSFDEFKTVVGTSRG